MCVMAVLLDVCLPECLYVYVYISVNAKRSAPADPAGKYQRPDRNGVDPAEQHRKLDIGKGGKRAVAVEQDEINLKCIPAVDCTPAIYSQDDESTEGWIVECRCFSIDLEALHRHRILA